MMWRRRNESDTWRGVTNFCNPGVDLVARQLASFARFCTLRNLDLNVVSIHQILTCDAKTPTSHLLDRRSLRIPIRHHNVSLGILATFSGIGFPTQTVHGDSHGFMSLL